LKELGLPSSWTGRFLNDKILATRCSDRNCWRVDHISKLNPALSPYRLRSMLLGLSMAHDKESWRADSNQAKNTRKQQPYRYSQYIPLSITIIFTIFIINILITTLLFFPFFLINTQNILLISFHKQSIERKQVKDNWTRGLGENWGCISQIEQVILYYSGCHPLPR
jgi:hypothetical protein